MFGMVMNSARLLFSGRLFKDTRAALMQQALATIIGAIVGIGVGKLTVAWLGAIVAGAVAGALLPRLYRDLKYA